MPSFIQSIIESPLDLNFANVIDRGQEGLSFVSKVNSVRIILGVVFLIPAVWFISQIIRNWNLVPVWTMFYNFILGPVFGVIAIVVLFGNQEKRFDVLTRQALSEAGMFGIKFKQVYPIPEKGQVTVTFRKEINSNAGGRRSTLYTRWYDLKIEGLSGMSFTASTNREVVLSAAEKIGTLLKYSVVNLATDDGVDRLPAGQDEDRDL